MKAEQLGDASGEIYFATWIANGMAVNNMADRAVQLLDRVEELARKSGFSEMPLQFSIAKVRALMQLSEPQKARGREEGKKLLASTLDLARKNGVSGAETELLSQAGQLAIEEHDFAGAERSFKEVVEIAKAADLPERGSGRSFAFIAAIPNRGRAGKGDAGHQSRDRSSPAG